MAMLKNSGWDQPMCRICGLWLLNVQDPKDKVYIFLDLSKSEIPSKNVWLQFG